MSSAASQAARRTDLRETRAIRVAVSEEKKRRARALAQEGLTLEVIAHRLRVSPRFVADARDGR